MDLQNFDELNENVPKLTTQTNSMMAPVMVQLEGETDPLAIATKELKYVFIFVF